MRHIERAGILVHLVEPLPMDGTDPLENYRTIRSELAQYKQELAERPEIICVSKAELPDAAEVQAAIAAETGREVLLLSAVTGAGLNELVRRMDEALKSTVA